MPKVSICIPCYNNAEEVKRLLDSILNQEYKDYEVNISDDSTNDEISIIIEEYKGKIQYINYTHNEKPYGHVFNWNAVLKMAIGEYIKIMFSDDWFTDSKSLSEFVGLLDNNKEAIFAFSGSRQVKLGKDKENSYDRFASKEYITALRNDYRYLLQSNQIGAPSDIIYRRDSKGEITLFDEKSNWASDVFMYFELIGKVTDKSKAFVYTEKPLVSIGIHENQYTESFSERDERVYNDYKYLYTKYNLKQSKECREYFTENYIVKYHKNLKEAKTLGIDANLFIRKYLSEFNKSIKCYISSHLKTK